jgi:hypothetical protein
MLQSMAKTYLCEGDISSLKQRAAQMIQMMPAEMLSNILKKSPICTPGGSMPMFGGKKQKTRKQKRKQRKTRKH